MVSFLPPVDHTVMMHWCPAELYAGNLSLIERGSFEELEVDYSEMQVHSSSLSLVRQIALLIALFFSNFAQEFISNLVAFYKWASEPSEMEVDAGRFQARLAANRLAAYAGSNPAPLDNLNATTANVGNSPAKKPPVPLGGAILSGNLFIIYLRTSDFPLFIPES